MENKIVYTGLLFVMSIFLVLNLVAADGYVNNVSLISPAADTWTIDTTPSFVFNVTGNQTYYNCTLYLNGTQKAQNTSSFNATGVTLISSTLTDGAYSWKVNCTNVTEFESDSRVLKLDSTSPTAALTRSPTSSIIDYLGFVTATCSGSDTNTITYLQYLISPSNAVTTTTDASHRFSGGTLKTIGTYQINCTVTDEAGNTGSATQLSFKVAQDTNTAQKAEATGILTNATLTNKNILVGIIILVILISVITITKKKK